MSRDLAPAEDQAGHNIAALRRILDLLDNTEHPLSGFSKIHKTLRMLGIATKIESARLGQSAVGFDTLADDVGLLSVQVQQKAQNIEVLRKELTTTVQKTLELLASIQSEQQADVHNILDKARTGLATLTSINGMCTEAVHFVTSTAEEESRTMGSVVTSMQFHDIVRQQVEHVRDTFAELGNCIGTAADSGQPCGYSPAETAHICALQCAQLRHARDELVQAVESIISNLQSIALQQSHIAEATSTGVGSAGNGTNSTLECLEQDLTSVIQLLGKSAEADRNLSAAATSLAGTVGEISGFVGEIEQISEEIELIALNAQIKAARSGIHGAALGVLAEEIQRLSLAAMEQTTAVSGTMMPVAESAAGLCSEVDTQAAMLEDEVSEMAVDINDMLQTIQRVNSELGGQLEQIRHAVENFSDDIREITGGITVHNVIATELDAVVDSLGGITAMTGTTEGALSEESLRRLSERYTMQSEWHIHSTLTGTAMATELFDATDAPADDDGMGDNVELF
jgi:methyl-accepting chemotaxis protein